MISPVEASMRLGLPVTSVMTFGQFIPNSFNALRQFSGELSKDMP